MSDMSEFSRAARDLSKNPLGIIALFIVLIYGMATIVIIQGNKLTTHERDIFTWFLVGYPVLVLVTFAWPVSRHSAKLYAPRDFKNQAHFMELQQVKEAIAAAANAARNGATPQHDELIDTVRDAADQIRNEQQGKAVETP
jgi:hypothetical protein